MQARKLGQFKCNPVGLGCMNLSHAYGTPPSESDGIQLLNQALDMGYDMLDTATLYGGGRNEQLLAKAVGHRRSEYVLASKCGMFIGDDGKKRIDGRPETIRDNCEQSLKRLNTDVIDLYYLHRWDKSVPVEESVGALSRLVEEGKIREIGLSEVSGETLIKAHEVYPIAAVQSEYSLWTRNPEISILNICRKLDTAFVAFSPLGRGMLTGRLDTTANFAQKDIRRNMPRFSGEHFAHNRQLVTELCALVAEHLGAGVARDNMAAVVLRWLLQKESFVHVIPGTTSLAHLEENFAANDLALPDALQVKMGQLINEHSVSGPRYSLAQGKEVDSEEFEQGECIV